MNDHIVMDNHFHLNYNNDFLAAPKLFQKQGGTAINLTVLPENISDRNHYRVIYEKTMNMAETIRLQTKLDVLITLGPYPLDFLNWVKLGMDPVEAMKQGVDLVCRIIEEEKANAIGEIGRIHFPVDETITEKLNEILEYSMGRAHDVNCPVILHTEDLSINAVENIENMARKNGLPLQKVVKHHALFENISQASEMLFSLPASRKNMRFGMAQDRPFFMETDYIDDPLDKNRYMPADSVPRRYATILQEYGLKREHLINDIFRTLPERVYGEDAFHKR